MKLAREASSSSQLVELASSCKRRITGKCGWLVARTGSDCPASICTVCKQERHAVVRKPRDAAAVVFRLKFADNIHYKFTSSQASKSRLQSSKRTGAKQHLTQNGHSRSRVLESVERR